MSKSITVDTHIDRANEVLSGPAGKASKQMLEELVALAGELVKYKNFSVARQILQHARHGLLKDSDPDMYDKIYQKSALYTYKDPDLPRDCPSRAPSHIGGRGAR